MRKYLLALICTAIALLTTEISLAQENYSFRHLNTKGHVIQSIYRDTNGILWFGTSSGLLNLPQMVSQSSRNNIRKHPHLDRSMRFLSGDANGNIWIRTLENDIYLYNPINGEFIVHPEQKLQEKGVNVSKMYWVKAQNGTIWVVKNSNIYILNNEIGTCERRVTSEEDGEIIDMTSFGDTLLITTQHAFYMMSLSNRTMEHRIELIKPLVNLEVGGRIDRFGNIWFINDKAIVKYDSRKEEWGKIIHTPKQISTLEIDADDHIWIGTRGSGIYIYNTHGKLLKNLRHSLSDDNSINSDRVDVIHYDSISKLMWIAYMKGGVSYYAKNYDDLRFGYITNGLLDDNETDVLSITSNSADKTIWMGMEDKGLCYRQQNAQKWNFTINQGSVTSLYQDKDDIMWVGLYQQGLVKLVRGKEEKRYFAKESPYAVVSDGNGLLYVALLMKGVWSIDIRTGECIDMNVGVNFALDLKYHKGNLYTATTEGFFVYNKKHGGWKKIAEGHFRSMCIDTNDYLWVLGNNGNEGLMILSPQNKIIDIPKKLSSAPLKSITADSNGKVWMVTPNELIVARNPNKLEYNIYNINPEQRHVYYNQKAIHVDENENLWLGTNNCEF